MSGVYTLLLYLSPKGSPYPTQGRERKPSVNITPLAGKIHVQVGLAPTPPGLDLRRAPRIVRELPPSLTAYRVAVQLRAAPLAAPTLVRSTVGTKSKTPECFVGAWPLAWAITQSDREDLVTTQAPTKHSGVRSVSAGCHTDKRMLTSKYGYVHGRVLLNLWLYLSRPLTGIFFEPSFERHGIGQQFDGSNL